MNAASKIVGQGTEKMKGEVDRKGTLWGSFFRTAFAVAMFKRLTKVIREGTLELAKQGDVGAMAAVRGLKEYDDAIKKLEMSIARALAPTLGKLGTFLADTIHAFEDLVDVYQFDVFGSGLDEELRKRDMIIRQMEKQRALMGQFGNLGANKAEFEKRGQPIKKALDDLVPAWQKHIDFIDLATKRLLDQDKAVQIIKNDFNAMLKTMGLAAEEDAFAKWGKSLQDLIPLIEAGVLKIEDFRDIVRQSGEQLIKAGGLETKNPFEEYITNVEKLNVLRRQGAIDDLRLAMLIGQQVEKLAEQQDKMERKAPEALIRGTAAAFSAINEFNRARGGVDVAKIQAAAAARAEAQRAEQIRIGKEQIAEEKKRPVVKIIGS